MPRPPPPAEALRITGKPTSRASRAAWLASSSGSWLPGSTGTPAALAVCRALALSPIRRMTSGRGPIQPILHSSSTSAKWAFSARNPYPGWTASAPVISAAEMMLEMFR